jgi:anti-sigma factor RsiW
MINNIDDGVDDETLAAYVDGELDANQQREIEYVLEHDPESRGKVCLIRDINSLLRAAYRDGEI